ncbi:LysR family transcriptional regulator [Streptomyces sp. NPDC087440]|uniref:LysR family transcriptional regulator n=1 Tax=Streptomyces sp. NPDC087440 TaxID=3365790 RepID=UPI0038146817
MERHETEIFLTLADELHFGRTAEKLLVSQARVSQVLKRLERKIGAPLFDRTSRSVGLTPLGRQLHTELGPLHAQMQAVLHRARAAARGIDGVLNVGFLGSGAGQLTRDIQRTFRERAPGCEVRMREVQFADPLGPLRAGEVDVLFTRLPVEESDLTVGPTVVSESRVLAVPCHHPLAHRETVSLEEAAGERFFGVTGGAPAYWWDAQVPRRTPGGAVLERGQDVSTFQEMLSMIAACQGVSPVVASVATYHSRPDLAYVPLTDVPNSDVALVWRTGGTTARSEAYIDAVRDTVRAHGGPMTL